MTDETAVWVYAVRADAAPPAPAGLTGVAGEPIRLLHQGDLAAAVGTMPPALADEARLREQLLDLRWLEQTVRRHHDVVDTLFRAAAAVPFRLATIYRSDERVRQLLDTSSPLLRQALSTATGAAEWGVRAYPLAEPATDSDDAGGTAVLSHPDSASATPAADPATPAAARANPTSGAAKASGPAAGTAYLLRRRAELAGRERARARAAAEAAELEAALAPLAVAVRRLGSGAGLGEPVPAVSNASYLVEHQRAAEFVECAHRLRERLPRLRLRLTGPWPPYSFVEISG